LVSMGVRGRRDGVVFSVDNSRIGMQTSLLPVSEPFFHRYFKELVLYLHSF
jgi:hypothetical protein